MHVGKMDVELRELEYVILQTAKLNREINSNRSPTPPPIFPSRRLHKIKIALYKQSYF